MLSPSEFDYSKDKASATPASLIETTSPRRTLTVLLMLLPRLLAFVAVVAALTWMAVNIPMPYTMIAFALAFMLRQPLILAASAIGLMIASALTFRNAIEFSELLGPVLLMLLGGAALWAAMQLDWRLPRIPALPLPMLPAQLSARWGESHIGLFMLGLVALAALMRINSVRFDVATAISDSVDTQFMLLVTGVTLIVVGLGRVMLPRRLPRVDWKSLLPIVGISGLGLTVRFWQLQDTARFFIDELFFADIIRYLWAWRYVPLIAPFDDVAAEPSMFPYWQSISVELFGRNFVGLRGASAIIGALTILSVYLLGRTLFDRKTALLGAVLLATFPPHLHFSRIGLSEVAMAFFGTTAFAFLARGVMTNRRFDYVLGGVMLGITHYFHEGGKYLFTPVAVLWLGGVWLFARPRLSARNLLLAALACVLVALPIYTTLLATQKPLAARMVTNRAGLDNDYWQALFDSGDFHEHIVQHLTPPFLIYIQHPDSTLFYAGHTPLLLAFVAPAFMLGVFYAIRRWYRVGPMLLVGWILFTSLGNSLLVESGNAARFVVVYPALMLLAAVGIRYTLPLIWPEQVGETVWPSAKRSISVGQGWALSLPKRLPPTHHLQFAFMLVLVIGIAAAQVDYYFNQHIPAFNEQTRENWGHRDAEDAVLRSVNFPLGTEIHIINRGDPLDTKVTQGVLDFMASGLSLDAVSSEARQLSAHVAGLDASIDHAFYVEPYDTATLELLRQHFDLLPPQVSPYNLPANRQYILYYAPARTTIP